MKTYKVEINGKQTTMSGLTDAVKEDITDVVRARELKTVLRLARKKLIEGDEFKTAQQAAQSIHFGSLAVIEFLTTDEGRTAIARGLLPDGADEADVRAVADAMLEGETDLGVTLRMIFEDAYPKKKTMTSETSPISTATE